MENLELTCFQMISAAGGARSCFVEAIQAAKAGDLEAARQMMADGQELFVEGHKAHMGLITKEANGEGEVPSLLLVHAEDQMMMAELYSSLAQDWLDLYARLEEEK